MAGKSLIVWLPEAKSRACAKCRQPMDTSEGFGLFVLRDRKRRVWCEECAQLFAPALVAQFGATGRRLVASVRPAASALASWLAQTALYGSWRQSIRDLFASTEKAAHPVVLTALLDPKACLAAVADFAPALAREITDGVGRLRYPSPIPTALKRAAESFLAGPMADEASRNTFASALVRWIDLSTGQELLLRSTAVLASCFPKDTDNTDNTGNPQHRFGVPAAAFGPLLDHLVGEQRFNRREGLENSIRAWAMGLLKAAYLGLLGGQGDVEGAENPPDKDSEVFSPDVVRWASLVALVLHICLPSVLDRSKFSVTVDALVRLFKSQALKGQVDKFFELKRDIHDRASDRYDEYRKSPSPAKLAKKYSHHLRRERRVVEAIAESLVKTTIVVLRLASVDDVEDEFQKRSAAGRKRVPKATDVSSEESDGGEHGGKDVRQAMRFGISTVLKDLGLPGKNSSKSK